MTEDIACLYMRRNTGFHCCIDCTGNVVDCIVKELQNLRAENAGMKKSIDTKNSKLEWWRGMGKYFNSKEIKKEMEELKNTNSELRKSIEIKDRNLELLREQLKI